MTGSVSSVAGLALGRLSILALFLISAPADSRDSESGGRPHIARLFADAAPLAVTITAPLTTLMTDRPNEEYLDGTLSFSGDAGAEQAVEVGLQTRGNYRREQKHCDFAPIRLNLRTQQLTGTVFAGQDKLKLVTHCQNDRPVYEQLLLREYLAYRFLNIMTDKSFGVRLLEITYVDTEGAKPLTKPGFVIEDDDAVAARNGMTVVKIDGIASDELDPAQQNLVHVFEYLISNTEYSLFKAEPAADCCHNSELLSATGGAPFTPLPYDFDFAGLVNAPYAQPNPRYELRNVRQRLYKGLCKNNDLLQQTLQLYLEKKDAIYGVVDELKLLSSRSRRDVLGNLKVFFDRISQPKSVEGRFIEKCIAVP